MHHTAKSHDCCKMTNSCDGPGSHLTTLFAYVGVLESPASTAVFLAKHTSAIKFVSP